MSKLVQSEQTNKKADEKADATGDSSSSGGGFKRFEGDGVQFKAKLIGSELVMEPRGDKICQDSIQRLKAIIRGQKAHKKRIVMKISYSGVKVLDDKSNELLYHSEVSQISFIASDDTDTRTFGYICDVPGKAHRFICFKTQGPAVQVMSVISSLFEAVLEQKKQVGQSANEQQVKSAEQQQQQTSRDHQSAQQQEISVNKTAPEEICNKQQQQQQEGQLDDCLEFGFGLVEAPVSPANKPLGSVKRNSNLDLVQEQLGDLFLGPSLSQVENNNKWDQIKLVQQSTLKSENSFEQPLSSTCGDSGILDSSTTSPFGTSMTNQSLDWSSPAATMLSGGPAKRPLVSSAAQPISLQRPPGARRQQQQQQHQQQQQPWVSSSLVNRNFTVASTGEDPFSMRMNNNNNNNNNNNDQKIHNNRSLIYNHSSVSLNEAALTRQPSFGGFGQNNMQQQPQTTTTTTSGTDKYAVFNDIENLPSIFESSSSLNQVDASHQVSNRHQLDTTANLSFGQVYPQQQQQAPANLYTTQQQAFASSNSHQAQQQARQAADLFFSSSTGGLSRQFNPFDDDFFA